MCLATASTKTNISIESDGRKPNEPILTIENFSKYKRLIRTTAFVLRFIRRIKAERDTQIKGEKSVETMSSIEELTATEIQQAELYWIEQQQQQFYSEEISTIKQTGVVHKASKILSLNPI